MNVLKGKFEGVLNCIMWYRFKMLCDVTPQLIGFFLFAEFCPQCNKGGVFYQSIARRSFPYLCFTTISSEINHNSWKY